MPSKTELAYAAGLFDGEGSISASRSSHSPANWRVIVAVSMCDKAPVEFMARVFGGRALEIKQKTKSGKAIYQWAVYCRNAAEVLKLLLPYLLVKSDKARDAIALAALMRSRTTQRVTITEEEAAQRKAIADRIRAANMSSNGRLVKYAAA